jgi:hypothetical protein
MLLALSLLLPAGSGCGRVINPYRDDLPSASIITTASAARVQETEVAGELRQRGWDTTMVRSQDQGVSHWPLWWQDYVEDSGSNDGRFAWTWCDYAYIVYGPARQAVNTAGLPVSMVIEPPGTFLCSDGVISRQAFGWENHDPVACSGVAVSPDLIEAEQATSNLTNCEFPPRDNSR